MRAPAYLPPSACFAHVAQHLQQGFAQLNAMTAMMSAATKRIAPQGALATQSNGGKAAKSGRGTPQKEQG